MVVSLTVIIACVASGVALIVCCFAPPCPMYDTCSGHANFGAGAEANSFFGGYIPSDMHPLTLNNGSLKKNGCGQNGNHNHAVVAPGLDAAKADDV